MIDQIEAQRKHGNTGEADFAQLEAERTKISQQIEFVIDSLGSVGKDAAKSKVQQLETKLMAVVEEIERARSTDKADDRSAETIAADMIAKLTKIAATIQTLPPPTLRSLLTVLIGRLEVDMATKVVAIEIAIPAWGHENALCLEDKFVQRPVYQAQMRISLDSADCRYARVGRTPCFNCRRVRRAA